MTLWEFVTNRGWDWFYLARFVGVIGRIYISIVIGSMLYATFLVIQNCPETTLLKEVAIYVGKLFLGLMLCYMVAFFPLTIFAFNTFGRRTQLTFYLLLILYGIVAVFVVYCKKYSRVTRIK